MEFCPKCGAILIQKIKNMGCPRCNYSSKENSKIKTSEKMETQKEIAVLKKSIDVRPVINEKCPKCPSETAHFWTVQQRGTDEAETKFFKCTKCEHTWRSYR